MAQNHASQKAIAGAQRLDKILSNLGYGSRREITALAKKRQITVDGECCTNAACKVDPEQSVITVSGETILWQPQYYLMLHKPAGFVTATKDNFQHTVIDLLPERLQKAGIFPVGRLDKDTEGLLLLTTDGAFSHALMAPRHHVNKVYEAEIEGVLAPDAVQQFAHGVQLEDGTLCRPAELLLLQEREGRAKARITLHEGKFHQVKRMVQSIGGKVIALKRISIGTLTLDETLGVGGYRPLTEQELQTLIGQKDEEYSK